MSRTEIPDPTMPHFSRSSSLKMGARCYTVITEEPVVHPKHGRVWQRLHLQDGAGGGITPITIAASDEEELKSLRLKIRSIAESEQIALEQYKAGILDKADFNRGQAMRLREILERDYGIRKLPKRGWTFENGMIIPGAQMRMF